MVVNTFVCEGKLPTLDLVQSQAVLEKLAQAGYSIAQTIANERNNDIQAYLIKYAATASSKNFYIVWQRLDNYLPFKTAVEALNFSYGILPMVRVIFELLNGNPVSCYGKIYSL